MKTLADFKRKLVKGSRWVRYNSLFNLSREQEVMKASSKRIQWGWIDDKGNEANSYFEFPPNEAFEFVSSDEVRVLFYYKNKQEFLIYKFISEAK